ncbi:MAG: hypothetical protein HKN13_13185 [Rhodothermales bacterium]|nr:hypothetical protein [Rhodothermales bacterium]
MPTGTLAIPGVGRIDLASIAPSHLRGAVIVDELPGTSVGVLRDRPTPATEWALGGTAVVDLGYQSNLNAVGSGFSVASRGSRIRTVASGNFTSGDRFESGSGDLYNSAFRHGGAFVRSTVVLPGRSSISADARLVKVGYAELPGGLLDIVDAHHVGGSVGWTSVIEGQRARRVHITVGAAQSAADLADRTGRQSASREWVSMEAQARLLHGLAALDIYVAGLDQLQAGIELAAHSYDWAGSSVGPTAVGVVADTLLDHERLQVSSFAVSRMRRGRFEVNLAGRIDVVRTRIGALSAGTSKSPVRRIRPAVAANVMLQLDRRWQLSSTLSVRSVEPSPVAMSPAAVPSAEGLPAAPVSGSLEMGAERLIFTGVRVTRETERQSISLRPYLFDIRGYVTPRLDTSSEGYAYANMDARIAGAELAARRQLLPFVTMSGMLTFAWGENLTLREPLPLMSPLNGRLDLEASAVRGQILFELSTEFAVRQHRVAESLDERPSDAYIACHLWLGVPLSKRLGLRTGIYNLFNASFSPHGHVFIEDQDVRLAAPGRSWLIAARFRY